MQMAKTSCACSRLDDEGLLYVNLITEPTFGGVTASFGMLGDIIVAEQGARVGFAGRRVIEQTIRQKLPSDSLRRATAVRASVSARRCAAERAESCTNLALSSHRRQSGKNRGREPCRADQPRHAPAWRGIHSRAGNILLTSGTGTANARRF